MNPLKLLNPVTVIKGAVGLAGTAVGVVESLAWATARTARSGLLRPTTMDHSGPGHEQAHPDVPPDVMDSSGTGEPTNLPVEPRVPAEPPVDVVGEALAAEAAHDDGQSLQSFGFAHEPRAASRAEQHGEAPMGRTEREEIEDEVTAALERDLADEGAEEHLIQPLLESGAAKALIAETEMLSRAADPNKG